VTVLAGLVVLLIILLAKPNTQRAIRRALKKISYDSVYSVSLDLGGEHFAYFDYIAVIDGGFLVIDLKDYAGHIFAADKIDMWTQIQNRKSYQFVNPTFELQNKIELLKLKLQHHHITGIVVFTDHADFPKGQPDNVLLVKELRQCFKRHHKKCADKGLWADWLAFKKLEHLKHIK
jgi:hypothetical protein